MTTALLTVDASAENTSIPSDAKTFNGHSYKFYSDLKTWDEAEAYCESLGGHLVTITSEEENEFVLSLLPEGSGAMIGINDIANEGDWSTWVTNEKVTFTNWGTNEPDDLNGNQDIGSIINFVDDGWSWRVEPGQWDDWDNGGAYHFICEWEPANAEKISAPTVTASNVASSGKIKLTWNAVDGAVSYKVYRAEGKNSTYKLMKTTSSTSYINTSAAAGQTYYYKVKSVAIGGAVSNFSSVKSRTCDLAKPVVTATNIASSGKIKLKWDKVEGATSYKVYRATSKDGTYKLMKTTTSTSYTNTSAVSGTTYYYKVKAVCSNSAADSAFSAIKTRTCDLAKPTNLQLYYNASGKPVVKWSKVDGATSYKVYRATSENGTYSLMKTTTSTNYTNTSVNHGTAYYYKIKAVCSNSEANSAYSSVISGYVK